MTYKRTPCHVSPVQHHSDTTPTPTPTPPPTPVSDPLCLHASIRNSFPQRAHHRRGCRRKVAPPRLALHPRAPGRNSRGLAGRRGQGPRCSGGHRSWQKRPIQEDANAKAENIGRLDKKRTKRIKQSIKLTSYFAPLLILSIIYSQIDVVIRLLAEIAGHSTEGWIL